MPNLFHKLASPPYFYALSGRLLPWLSALLVLLLAAGAYGGLLLAPTDFRQGEAFRIIYVHVPSAWMSLFVYLVMAISGAIAIVWRMKLAEIMVASSAPIGAAFTFLALVTGSLWGKPMWGTWWVWDARLTSELILLFLYLGIIGLHGAIEDRRDAARAASMLALVGVVNLPIIHYSVQWWNTLHQAPSVSKFDQPSIHIDMLWPLLVMALAFKVYYLLAVLLRCRTGLLESEANTRWVEEVVEQT